MSHYLLARFEEEDDQMEMDDRIFKRVLYDADQFNREMNVAKEDLDVAIQSLEEKGEIQVKHLTYILEGGQGSEPPEPG